MNSLITGYFVPTFQLYQAIRPALMETLTDDDLGYSPGGANPSLGVLCREIGEIEHSYVEAFRTFRQDFAWRNPDPDVGRRVAVLSTWYSDLDRELLAALEALTDDQVANRRIWRHDFDVEDFSPLPAQELDIYREALLIFYAKVSVHLRIMGRELPGHWNPWIG